MLMVPFDIMLNDLVADDLSKAILYTRETAHDRLRALSKYELDFGNDVAAWKAWLIETFPDYRSWVEIRSMRASQSGTSNDKS